MPEGALKYRADIDGLRAIAVLSVLGFHAFPGYFPGGFLGVDVFFVISGFLITSLLLRERAITGKISIADFYSRRIRRLFPALLVVIAATTIAGYFLLFAHEFARLTNHAWASLFFVENILLATESGYFDIDAHRKPLLHFWSLAVEEQFYIVWPLTVIFLARSMRIVAGSIAIFLIASLALTFSGTMSEPWHFYSPLTRVWELAAGAGLAWWVEKYARCPLDKSPKLAAIISLSALASLVGVTLLGSSAWKHPGTLTLIPVTATLALIAAGPGGLANRHFLAFRPAVWIGLISYPLYLWHWPLLSYLSIATEERGPPLFRLGMVGLSIALAAATYHLIERPIRTRWPRKQAVQTLTIGIFAVAFAIALALQFRPGNSEPIEAITEDQLEGVAWRYMENETCRAEQRADYTAFCAQNMPGKVDVLLFGNSYANHLYPGLITQPHMKGQTVLSFGTCELSGTFPEIYNDCAAQWAILEEMDKGSMVLVANQWPLFDRAGRMTDLQTDDPGAVSDYPGLTAYGDALANSVAKLAAKGIPVVLVGPKPELGYDVADCFARPLRPATRDCRVSRSAYDESSAMTVRLLQDLADRHRNVYFFDLADVFCLAGTCNYLTDEGLPLLRDDNGHFSVLGSKRVGTEILTWAAQEKLLLP